MKKIYYEKVGKRYKPVAEYNDTFMDSFTKGNHLVMCYPGGTSRRFNIEPALAPMIAAGRYAQSAMNNAMYKASELRPTQTPITERQRKAWANLAKELGSDLCSLTHLSTYDISEAGIKAMQVEADKLMQHAAVKEAYDQFMLIAKLASIS